MKRQLSVGVFLISCFICDIAFGQEDLARLQEEVKALKDEVSLLRKTVDKKNKENEKLQADNEALAKQVTQLQEALKKAGVEIPGAAVVAATATPAASAPAKGPTPQIVLKTGECLYLGKAKPPEWFEIMYKKFADKIIYLDGKYIDIGKTLVSNNAGVGVDEIGAVGETPFECKVLQIINGSEILVIRPAKVDSYYSRLDARGDPIPGSLVVREIPELLFHVKNVNTKGLVDNGRFSGKLLYIGTYQYTTVSKISKTIASYVPCVTLTKEQFTEALAGGFQLISYEIVRQNKPGGGTETKIVEKPVP